MRSKTLQNEDKFSLNLDAFEILCYMNANFAPSAMIRWGDRQTLLISTSTKYNCYGISVNPPSEISASNSCVYSYLLARYIWCILIRACSHCTCSARCRHEVRETYGSFDNQNWGRKEEKLGFRHLRIMFSWRVFCGNGCTAANSQPLS